MTTNNDIETNEEFREKYFNSDNDYTNELKQWAISSFKENFNSITEVEDLSRHRNKIYQCDKCKKFIHNVDWFSYYERLRPNVNIPPLVGVCHNRTVCLRCWKNIMEELDYHGMERLGYLTFTQGSEQFDYEWGLKFLIMEYPDILHDLGIMPQDETMEELGITRLPTFEETIEDDPTSIPVGHFITVQDVLDGFVPICPCCEARNREELP